MVKNQKEPKQPKELKELKQPKEPKKIVELVKPHWVDDSIWSEFNDEQKSAVCGGMGIQSAQSLK